MKLFILLIILTFTVSCSLVDIDYHMPAAQFETSEVSGNSFFQNNSKVRGHLQAGYGSSQKFTLAEVYETFIFGQTISTDAELEASATWTGMFSWGMVDGLDISIKNSGDSPMTIGLKYQFLGKSESQGDKGWSSSLLARYGGSEKDEGTANVTSGGQSRTYNATLEITVYEFALISGYRFTKSWLMYLNTFHNIFDTHSVLKSSQFSDVTVDGYSRQTGALWGNKFTSSPNGVYLLIELGAVKGGFEKYIDHTYFSGGLTLGVNL